MPEVDKSAVLKVPASDVFALLEDVERNPEWVPRMVTSERLTSGPTVVGTRFRFALDLEFMGLVIDGVDEVVELVPDRLLRSRSVEGLLTYISSWELEPVGDDGAATRVTYRMGFKLPPSLERLATRFFNLDALTAAQAESGLQNLRRILEKGPSDE